ncbi:MAG: hypothetical protein KatS3mg108_0368 [Isosphaeraceae bacterium]|nr:MAG: hypothetical protein KatS3mg108_0368 [Isosphaeraceae bacterium]
MSTPREGSPRRSRGRRLMLWAALAGAGAAPVLVGCQAEYAGMTLPSGKYLYDDVQHFRDGPDFPWANTNAATQRARMQAMGYDVDALAIPGQGGPITPPAAAGMQDPTQMRAGMPTNVNVLRNQPGGEPMMGAPAPGQPVPEPPMPGADLQAPPLVPNSP